MGYQVPGTPGRDILTLCRKPNGYVVIKDRKLQIRAGVHVMPGYSAHADQNGLVQWVTAMDHPPAWIKLVHGEEKARDELRAQLGSRFRIQDL